MQHFAQKSDTMFGKKTYGKPYADMVQWHCRTGERQNKKERVSGQTDSRKRREWKLEN